MHFYPEETGGRVSEVWHAERWKEYNPEELTPMFVHGTKQFYLNEVAALDDGQIVMPQAYIIRNKELTADCWRVNIGLVR